MEFFDKLGKKASKTYKEATEKTNKFAKETKLKIAMNDNKSKIEDIYEEIGRKVYEKHVRDADVDISELIQEDCSRIDVLADEIEIARKEILSLKDKKQCPNCSYEIDLDYHYCPNCGKKQDEETVQIKEVEVKEDTQEQKEEEIEIKEEKQDKKE